MPDNRRKTPSRLQYNADSLTHVRGQIVVSETGLVHEKWCKKNSFMRILTK